MADEGALNGANGQHTQMGATPAGEVRIIRTNESGEPVAGKAHVVATPIDGFVDDSPVTKTETDISEKGALVITIENGQTGSVRFILNGLYESLGTVFQLSNQILGPGATAVHTLTDPWAFLGVSADAQSGLQTGTSKVTIQEQT